MNKIYNDAVEVAKEFLGPAAERFMERQIRFHLEKDPEKLEKSDLSDLAKWVKTSASLITDDKSSVEQFAQKISAL